MKYDLFSFDQTFTMTNQFGGSWTERKMEIVVSYARAYLVIMNSQPWAKTIYFDGFAGSVSIEDLEMERNLLQGIIPEENADIFYKNVTSVTLFDEQITITLKEKKVVHHQRLCLSIR